MEKLTYKERYALKKEKGICTKCPIKAKYGMTLCEKHLEARRERTRKSRQKEECIETGCSNKTKNNRSRCEICLKQINDTYHKNKNGRICVLTGCNNKTENKHSYCEACRLKNRSMYEVKKEIGLCTTFGCSNKPEKEKFARCPKCRGEQALHAQRKKEKGICASKGKCKNLPGEGNVYCKSCLKNLSSYSKKRRKEKKANNICRDCNNKSLENNGFCFDCWLKKIARTRLRDTSKHHILKELWEKQDNGVCVLTGEKLTPGVDASVDHIVPVSKGGGNEKENLRWVSLQSNVLKLANSDQELFSFCLKIIKHNFKNLSKNEQEDLKNFISSFNK